MAFAYFHPRAGAPRPDPDTLRAWFAKRPHVKIDDDGDVQYANESTGVELTCLIRTDDDRAPIELDTGNLVAHVIGLEAADVAGDIATSLDLLVAYDGPDDQPGPFVASDFVARWNALNEEAYQAFYGRGGEDPKPALPAEQLEAIWHWNRQRDALADELGDDIFVARVSFAIDGAAARTYVAWVDGTPARFPAVDTVVTPRKSVAWTSIAAAITPAARGDHFAVEGEHVARITAAIGAAPALDTPPQGIALESIATRELVDRYVLPPDERARRQRAMKLALEAQLERYTGDRDTALRMFQEVCRLAPNDRDLAAELARIAHEAEDHVAALEAGARLFALDPTNAEAALIAAINGTYAARYTDALALADKLRILQPDERNPHLIRGAALTELARYDEAIAAIDAALALDDEAMAVNMKAYALAALGRTDEARTAYERALALLDDTIADDDVTAAEDDDATDDDDNNAAADIHGRSAYALLGLGRGHEALAAAKASLAISPDEFLSLQSAGRACLLLGQPKQALAFLDRAIASRPAAPLAAFHAAEAHIALDHRDAAREALAGALASPHFERLARADSRLAPLVDEAHSLPPRVWVKRPPPPPTKKSKPAKKSASKTKPKAKTRSATAAKTARSRSKPKPKPAKPKAKAAKPKRKR